VNIPSYSPALPRMPGSDWRNFPQPIDGAQLNASRPQFAAFAGIGEGYGAFDYSRPGIGVSREVQGGGGYRYRQFKDGAIMVLVSPRPDLLPPGTIITGANPSDPSYQRWVAITTEIGAWKDFVKARTAGTLKSITDLAVAASTTAQQFKKKSKGKRRAAAAAPVADLPAEPMSAEAPAESSWMQGPLPWVVGGTVAVLLVVALVRSGSSSTSK